MIIELTQEQKSRFMEFVDKWTKIGLSTEPANRPKAEDGVRIFDGATPVSHEEHKVITLPNKQWASDKVKEMDWITEMERKVID